MNFQSYFLNQTSITSRTYLPLSFKFPLKFEIISEVSADRVKQKQASARLILHTCAHTGSSGVRWQWPQFFSSLSEALTGVKLARNHAAHPSEAFKIKPLSASMFNACERWLYRGTLQVIYTKLMWLLQLGYICAPSNNLKWGFILN